jgi:transposase-like protein
MQGNNRPLSKYRRKKIFQCFCLDLTATQTSKLLKVNRNTVNRYCNLIRRAIYIHQLQELKKFKGEIEIDESYFGAKRPRGKITKKDRGTHKQPVFGIYERDGKVYTEIIPNCEHKTLHKIISGRIDLKSTIYSDSWKGYNGLVDVGYDKHIRLKHHRDEFSRKRSAHLNGIEAFWSFTKRRLAKFNGVKKNFELHLKECEWRWNKTYLQLQVEL